MIHSEIYSWHLYKFTKFIIMPVDMNIWQPIMNEFTILLRKFVQSSDHKLKEFLHCVKRVKIRPFLQAFKAAFHGHDQVGESRNKKIRFCELCMWCDGLRKTAEQIFGFSDALIHRTLLTNEYWIPNDDCICSLRYILFCMYSGYLKKFRFWVTYIIRLYCISIIGYSTMIFKLVVVK